MTTISLFTSNHPMSCFGFIIFEHAQIADNVVTIAENVVTIAENVQNMPENAQVSYFVHILRLFTIIYCLTDN